jgi:hypothetical protein
VNIFIRVVLFGTISFGIIEILPLAWLNFVFAWIIVVGAAYRYPHLILNRVQTMSSAVGFSAGMGLAIGAIINTLGVILTLLFHSLFAASSLAHNSAGHSIGALNGISAVGDLFQIFGAPFVGAILGLIGGLIGGSTVPKSSLMMPAER